MGWIRSDGSSIGAVSILGRGRPSSGNSDVVTRRHHLQQGGVKKYFVFLVVSKDIYELFKSAYRVQSA